MVKTFGDYDQKKYTFFGLFSKQDKTDEAIFKFEIRIGGLNYDPNIVYVTPSQRLGCVQNWQLVEAQIIRQSDTEFLLFAPFLIEIDEIPRGQVFTDKYFVKGGKRFWQDELQFTGT